MKGWIRILVVAGWVAIGGMVLMGQWGFVRVEAGKGHMAWNAGGVEVAWIGNAASGGWGVETGANVYWLRYFVLPFARWGTRMCGFYVPWLWVVGSWGAVNWGVWRLTRERRVVGAFEVGKVVGREETRG